ncbi:MAG: HAD family phosphatase [archaeon]
MIKAIIFDFGGVFSNYGSFAPFVKFYASKFDKDIDEFYEVIRKHYRDARVNKISGNQFWKEVAKYLGNEPEQVQKDCMKFFGFNEKVRELAVKLKKHYKLGILSNHVENWFDLELKKHKLYDLIDEVVVSYEEKMVKPEEEFYLLIVNRLNVKPNECVFIDDQYRNLVSADKLGIKVVHFRDIEQVKEDLKKLNVNLND